MRSITWCSSSICTSSGTVSKVGTCRNKECLRALNGLLSLKRRLVYSKKLHTKRPASADTASSGEPTEETMSSTGQACLEVPIAGRRGDDASPGGPHPGRSHGFASQIHLRSMPIVVHVWIHTHKHTHTHTQTHTPSHTHTHHHTPSSPSPSCMWIWILTCSREYCLSRALQAES